MGEFLERGRESYSVFFPAVNRGCVVRKVASHPWLLPGAEPPELRKSKLTDGRIVTHRYHPRASFSLTTRSCPILRRPCRVHPHGILFLPFTDTIVLHLVVVHSPPTFKSTPISLNKFGGGVKQLELLMDWPSSARVLDHHTLTLLVPSCLLVARW